MIYNETKKLAISNYFKTLSKRDQILMLEKLSAPWIEKGALKCNAKTIEEILTLNDISATAEKALEEKVKQVSKIISRGSGITMGGANRMKPKRTRLKRK